MNGPLSLETARGAMRMLATGEYAQIYHGLGLTEEDYALLTGSNIWLPAERSRVRRCLDAFSAGVMDLTGVPHFELPAEFVAAVICALVKGPNIQLACRWMEGMRPANELASATADAHVLDPTQLFALCCQLYDDRASQKVKEAFEKKVSRAIHRAQNSEGGDNVGSKSRAQAAQ